MNKYILLFLVYALLAIPSQAQTLDEWFRQQETQKKYLVQQIAALQAHAGTLRQGYESFRQGISTVQQSKNGDLGLHQVFYHALRQASPVIGQSPHLANLLSWHAAITRELADLLAEVEQHGLLSLEERHYLGQVQALVLQACARDMETLWLLVSGDALTVSTAERLKGLESLAAAMQTRFQFTRFFIRETRLLALHQVREKRTLRSLELLYGLPHPL